MSNPLVERMREWANDEYEHNNMWVEIESALDVPAAVMARVSERRRWYLTPDESFGSVDAYIDATYAAFKADVCVCQAELKAERAAALKRRRAELKAERATERAAEPPRASRRLCL